MKNYLSILILLFVLIFSSCKKEEESNTDKLCGKFWVMTEATVDPSIPVLDQYGNIVGYTSNIFAQLDECDQDDVQKYNSDGTFEWNARTRCSVNDLQSGHGTWVFNDDETVITESEGGQSRSSDILELTGSKYKFSYKLSLNGVSYTIVCTCEPE